MKKFLFLSLFLSTLVACSVDNEELQEDEFAALNAQAEDCTVNAGEDNFAVFTNPEIDARIDDFGQVRLVYLDLLEEGVDREGTFSPSLRSVFRSYLRNTYGDFTTTYTVGEGECTDSTELTISVCEEIYDAGSDNTVTVTQEYVNEQINDMGEIDDFYLDHLLDEGIDRNGNFEDSNNVFYRRYVEEGPGTYERTYNLGEGNCGDSAVLTLIITE